MTSVPSGLHGSPDMPTALVHSTPQRAETAPAATPQGGCYRVDDAQLIMTFTPRPCTGEQLFFGTLKPHPILPALVMTMPGK